MKTLDALRKLYDGKGLSEVVSIIKTKKAIRDAFLVQIQNQGFGLVEVLAACPTNWRLDSAGCMEKIKSEIIPHFPLKTFSSPKKED